MKWALLSIILVASVLFTQSSEAFDQNIVNVDGVEVKIVSKENRIVEVVPRSGYNLKKLRSAVTGEQVAPVTQESTNSTLVWELQLSANAVFTDLSFADTQVGYATGELGIVYKTEDGGKSWTKILDMGHPYFWYGVHAFNANEVVICGCNNPEITGLIRWSYDGGNTWGDVITIDPAGWLDKVEFADRNHGIVTSWNGRVYYTSNGGAQTSDWTSVQAVPSDSWFGGQFTFLQNLQAWITGIYFCHSTDGGATWTYRPSIDITFDGPVHFLDDTVGATGGGTISPFVIGWFHKTTDGGNSWSIPLLIPPYPIRALMHINKDQIFSVGGNVWSGVGGIYYTSNGGLTWNLELNTGMEMSAVACQPVDSEQVDVWIAGFRNDGGNFTSNIYKTRVSLAQQWGPASIIGQEHVSPSRTFNYLMLLLVPAFVPIVWKCVKGAF